MPRRALLVFANAVHADLAGRALPKAARPLFRLAGLGRDIPLGVDVHFFTSGAVAASSDFSAHQQVGANFASRFENAVETIAALGYDEVVAIGRDCPALQTLDVERAFAELKFCDLVLGPDHLGGCYLIAFRCPDRGLVRGVRWKQNTDCRELVRRAGAEHVFLLPVKHDLDSWNDVRLFARADHALGRLAAFLLSCVATAGSRTRNVFVSLASGQIRVRQQMPPPAFAA
jgi:hypothetical protein